MDKVVHAEGKHSELTTETDARGVTVSRSIDALDRVTAVTYPDSSRDTLYTYDDPAVPFSKGRLTRIARPDSVIDYRYDRFGRLLQDGALGFTWDANGNADDRVSWRRDGGLYLRLRGSPREPPGPPPGPTGSAARCIFFLPGDKLPDGWPPNSLQR
jgi:YD repeat-containing protein